MAFTLHQLLLDAAENWPERPALTMGSRTLDFAELACRANAIAAVLTERGIKRGDRVALYMDRNFDSVAAIYGIMQAGAGYVAFDAAAPVESLAQVVEDCAIAHIFADEVHAGFVDAIRGGRGLTAVPWADVDAAEDAPRVERGVIEQDLCLLFYTSGSTGRPKGVAHAHRSMLASVEWAVRSFQLTQEDRFAHVTSHHFDLSWFELFASMAVGASIELLPERALKFPAETASLVEAARISVWCSVPSVLVGLAQRGQLEARDLSCLRRIHFAGERFPTQSLRQLMAQLPQAQYTNMYGTTETHIAAWWPVPNPLNSDEPLPIGRACNHLQLMIVDPEGRAVTDGETGELVIRGPSLMEGYWRLPERTARAVVELDTSPSTKGRFYRTGDLTQRLPSGDIRVVGRGDRRVKVRGYLVDLDDIEKVMLIHPSVLEATCFLVGGDTPEARIEGAVRLRPEAAATGAELRLHVGRALPTYACPDTVIVLADFPRTGSGKVDRRRLEEVAAAWRSQRHGRMTDDSPSETIRRFVLDELIGMPDTVLDDNTHLIGDWIDSMGVAQLVAFVEERYQVTIANEDFVAKNFETITAVARLVNRLLGAR
jgi:amino acid adenylation domain-containing protein